jgi:uncharacterized membrane protein
MFALVFAQSGACGSATRTLLSVTLPSLVTTIVHAKVDHARTNYSFVCVRATGFVPSGVILIGEVESPFDRHGIGAQTGP